jgi:hypothetical protein
VIVLWVDQAPLDVANIPLNQLGLFELEARAGVVTLGGRVVQIADLGRGRDGAYGGDQYEKQ